MAASETATTRLSRLKFSVWGALRWIEMRSKSATDRVDDHTDRQKSSDPERPSAADILAHRPRDRLIMMLSKHPNHSR
jgi:hypothetical protein